MLTLLRLIAHLRSLYHRLVAPRIIYFRSDDPAHSPFCSPLSYFTTKHKPAVVMVHSSIVQFQFSRKRFHGKLLVLIVGTGGKLLSFSIRKSDDVIGTKRAIAFCIQLSQIGFLTPTQEIVSIMSPVRRLCKQWRVRLLRIYTRLIIHNPRLAKKLTWEKLQVESHLSKEKVRNRFIQVDIHHNTTPLRLHGYHISERIIRINHRIESGNVTGRIRVTECGNNPIPLNLTAKLFRYRLPLPRSSLHTDISVRSNTLTVHNDADTTLMTFRIEIAKNHDISTTGIEIAVILQLERLCTYCLKAQEQETHQNREESESS